MKTTIYLFIIFLLSGCVKNQNNSSETKEEIEFSDMAEPISETETVEEIPLSIESDTLQFSWESDLCYNIGYFHKDQYTIQQLNETYQLWRNVISLFNYHVFIRESEDVDKIDISELTREYEKLIDFLNQCEPVNTPFWKELIVSEKERAEKDYYLQKMKLEAYSNPSVLLENKYSYEDCDNYAKIIASTDTVYLLSEWKKWTEEQSKSNGDPNYMNKFYTKYSSPNNVFYARTTLITYAWWNYMNHHIDRANESLLIEEFNKLFFKIDMDCEEP